jgi:hypothetical protein
VQDEPGRTHKTPFDASQVTLPQQCKARHPGSSSGRLHAPLTTTDSVTSHAHASASTQYQQETCPRWRTTPLYTVVQQQVKAMTTQHNLQGMNRPPLYSTHGETHVMPCRAARLTAGKRTTQASTKGRPTTSSNAQTPCHQHTASKVSAHPLCTRMAELHPLCTCTASSCTVLHDAVHTNVTQMCHSLSGHTGMRQ